MLEATIKKGENLSVLVEASHADERVYHVMDGGILEFVYLGLQDSAGESVDKNFGQYSFELEGENAGLNFYGFILGKGMDEFNLSGLSRCLNRRGKVNFNLRSALFDSSRVNFEGDMVIESNGHESESYLSHKTLLLSDKARTKTIPALEIKANDVKAGHAATLGRIDAQDLFYLKSRGISEHNATKMILKGYFEGLLKTISDEEMGDQVRELLFKHL